MFLPQPHFLAAVFTENAKGTRERDKTTTCAKHTSPLFLFFPRFGFVNLPAAISDWDSRIYFPWTVAQLVYAIMSATAFYTTCNRARCCTSISIWLESQLSRKLKARIVVIIRPKFLQQDAYSTTLNGHIPAGSYPIPHLGGR